MNDGDLALEEWYNAIKSADTIDKIEEIRICVFGKKGIMNEQFARMKDVPDAEKGVFAKELNMHKEGLNALLIERKLVLALAHLEQTMKEEAIDVSLFSPQSERPGLLRLSNVVKLRVVCQNVGND